MLYLESGVNAIYLTFAKKLSLRIRSTDIGMQKIDGTMLDIYRMVVAVFLIINKANRVKFFEETFLVANISPKVGFGMLYFTFSKQDIYFLD